MHLSETYVNASPVGDTSPRWRQFYTVATVYEFNAGSEDGPEEKEADAIDLEIDARELARLLSENSYDGEGEAFEADPVATAAMPSRHRAPSGWVRLFDTAAGSRAQFELGATDSLQLTPNNGAAARMLRRVQKIVLGRYVEKYRACEINRSH